jgi:cyclic beta-1,2-glucan synthetase
MRRATSLSIVFARLIEASRVGEHGLPLMGAGDWNDGMNRVGQDGKGESVWLGWFLYTTIAQFLKYLESSQSDGSA